MEHEMSSYPSDPSRDLPSLFRLDGRVAFVSGATGWLGRHIAEILASAGAHVILNARSSSQLQNLCAEFEEKRLAVSSACFDVADFGAIDAFVEDASQRFGRLDVIVNNAYSGRPGTIETATTEDFDQAYRVSVLAAFHLIRQSLPLLKAATQHVPSGASVINVSSMYGVVSPDPSIYGTSGANSPPYYGAAKAALLQMTRYAACHLAPDRIRVNAISPGPFPAQKYLDADPAFRSRLEQKVPMRRTGDPRELRGPFLFLASDASSFVTGINLAVDGGWTAW
jgi:NAD(P)-dependent dehydrogenase (short-subunit alcohol dehydrogenase family)